MAADVATDCVGVAGEDRPSAVVKGFARWQWFWGVERAELGPERALGLFGELWFLRYWLGASAEAVAAWTAGTGARHDFQWLEASVECKAATGSGGPVHRIHGLDQLDDPEAGNLHLFSLHVARDELAANSLAGLAEQIETDLAGDAAAQRDFRQRLASHGYSPAHAIHYRTGYRILREALYRVTGDFPRLTANSFVGGLPTSIFDVTYALDLSGCDEWVVATKPEEWQRPLTEEGTA